MSTLSDRQTFWWAQLRDHLLKASILNLIVITRGTFSWNLIVNIFHYGFCQNPKAEIVKDSLLEEGIFLILLQNPNPPLPSGWGKLTVTVSSRCLQMKFHFLLFLSTREGLKGLISEKTNTLRYIIFTKLHISIYDRILVHWHLYTSSSNGHLFWANVKGLLWQHNLYEQETMCYALLNLETFQRYLESLLLLDLGCPQ